MAAQEPVRHVRQGGQRPDQGHRSPDQLADDQSQLTYSFDIGDVHFVVINTDTLTTDIDTDTKTRTPAGSPITGSSRISAGPGEPQGQRHLPDRPQADHGPPEGGGEAILNTKETPFGDKLQALFQANDKVRAYLAHEHLWDHSPLDKAQGLASDRGQCRQPARTRHPPGGPFFGFSQINVYASGKVGLVNYQRPASKHKKRYISGLPSPPPQAQPKPEINP